jgi:hypothetical protein
VNSSVPEDSTGELKYETYAVCFLDILGFRDLVKAPSNLAIAVDHVKDFKKHSESLLFPDHLPEERIQISDSIIIWSKVESLSQSFLFLARTCLRILILHSSGIYTRGAISYGDHFFSEGILVSPALIEAYDLETKACRDPRCIVSPSFLKTMSAFKEDEVDRGFSRSSLFELMCRNDDGHYAVDYLNVLVQGFKLAELPIDKAVVGDALDLHRLFLEKKLAAESRADVRSKLVWLANYHNKSIVNHFGGDQKFLVAEAYLAIDPSIHAPKD